MLRLPRYWATLHSNDSCAGRLGGQLRRRWLTVSLAYCWRMAGPLTARMSLSRLHARPMIGNTALLFKTAGRTSAPRRRAPAKNLDIDGAGALAKLLSQTCKAARFCARGKVEEKDVGDAECEPLGQLYESWMWRARWMWMGRTGIAHRVRVAPALGLEVRQRLFRRWTLHSYQYSYHPHMAVLEIIRIGNPPSVISANRRRRQSRIELSTTR